jgi:hypothetical protein
MGNGEQATSLVVLPSTRISGDLQSRIERFHTWFQGKARAVLGSGAVIERPDTVRNLIERGLDMAEREMAAEAGNAERGVAP